MSITEIDTESKETKQSSTKNILAKHLYPPPCRPYKLNEFKHNMRVLVIEDRILYPTPETSLHISHLFLGCPTVRLQCEVSAFHPTESVQLRLDRLYQFFNDKSSHDDYVMVVWSGLVTIYGDLLLSRDDEQSVVTFQNIWLLWKLSHAFQNNLNLILVVAAPDNSDVFALCARRILQKYQTTTGANARTMVQVSGNMPNFIEQWCGFLAHPAYGRTFESNLTPHTSLCLDFLVGSPIPAYYRHHETIPLSPHPRNSFDYWCDLWCANTLFKLRNTCEFLFQPHWDTDGTFNVIAVGGSHRPSLWPTVRASKLAGSKWYLENENEPLYKDTKDTMTLENTPMKLYETRYPDQLADIKNEDARKSRKIFKCIRIMESLRVREELRSICKTMSISFNYDRSCCLLDVLPGMTTTLIQDIIAPYASEFPFVI